MARKLAGNENRKNRHDSVIEEYNRAHKNDPVAQPQQQVQDLSDFEKRLTHGVVKHLKASVENEQNEWLRT